MKKYPSDLTDAQWLNIKKLLDEKMLQRKRRWELRSIFDALFYLIKGGIQWRMLPKDFAPWQTVYFYFRQWKEQGLLQRVYTALHEKVRIKAGKKSSPSLGIIDSQSVKTSLAGGSRGFDNAKKTKGRKRHLAVDTLGWFEGSHSLAKDFERLPRSSEAMIHLTMIKIDLQKLSN